MEKQYRYRTTSELSSGGYPNEEIGVSPNDTSWHTTTSPTGSISRVYYYRDSNSATNANSSRVEITIRDEWSVSFDESNNMTVTVNTYLDRIIRGSIIGNPLIGGNATRHLRFYREAGGAVLAEFTNDPIGTAHTILGNTISFGSFTFILPPGQGARRSTVYFSNYTTGFEHIPPPTTYADILLLGVELQNILPRDYRPGAVVGDDGEWYSHNRSAGTAMIFDGQNWVEMRTADGGVGTDNPPMIYSDDGWKNMRKIGKE